ncbi:Ig-like domain-containing protein [Aeromicrobium ginsengisoli]|uniref:Ig-like domain-containing protein n=1 Tax=Aeromicrobium ginsengisoli TaxID=363867 RepID=UPI00165FFC8F|nr:Ig-like domain-containing protein [Aeromicrobium ginsengisoli]
MTALILGVVAPSAAMATDPVYTAYGRVFLEGTPSGRGIDVYLQEDDYTAPVYVDTTDSQGMWSVTGGHEVMSGEVIYVDSAHQYLSTGTFRWSTYGNSREAETVTMQLGAAITGRVLAPSGRPLKNVKVAYQPQFGDGATWQDRTTSDGGYLVAPVAQGPVIANLTLGTTVHEYEPAYLPFSEPGPDGVARAVDQDFTGIKAPVTISLTGTSPSKGRAILNVSVSAATYGLPGPGGKVTIYDSTRVVKRNLPLSSTGKATVSLTGLGRRSHSFWLKFSGATDTLPKTSYKRNVAVK